MFCTTGNILGDSWACCQDPGLPLFSASSKCRSGAWPRCNGNWHSAFGSLQLLKPFFPLCPEKAAARRCLFTGPTCYISVSMRALSAVSSVGLGAQRGMAPPGRYPPARPLLQRQLLHLLKLISIETECCTHVPNSAPEQPDSPADTIILATDGDRARRSRPRAAANVQRLF